MALENKWEEEGRGLKIVLCFRGVIRNSVARPCGRGMNRLAHDRGVASGVWEMQAVFSY